MSEPTLYRECGTCEATGCLNMMAFDCDGCDGRGFVPVESSRVFTVENPWDNEVWLPDLFDKGDRVVIVKIGGSE